MRTKTILLSAVVGVLSSASLMAQVYSLNAVGYINVTIPPGFSIFANQLNTTNNNFSPLLDSQFQSGAFDGVQIYKYKNGSGFTTLTVDSLNDPFPWDQAIATSTTLNPGEAAFVHNPYSTNLTVTFVGTVLTGAVNTTNAVGFNLASDPIPQAGRLTSDLGMPEFDGNQIYIFNLTNINQGPSGYAIYTGDALNTPPYDLGGVPGTNKEPAVVVGQGFWFSATAQNGKFVWNQNFSVN
jgi:hypothetical protein